MINNGRFLCIEFHTTVITIVSRDSHYSPECRGRQSKQESDGADTTVVITSRV